MMATVTVPAQAARHDKSSSGLVDEILVATARLYGCPLVTSDRKLRAYPHVNSVY